ncbi:MAG: phage tail protein I [Methylomonas sp.]|nr:MAG: phage tail protein I [Methylomonas sp.]
MEAWVSRLLPPNATAQEHALDDSIARMADVPVEIATLWNSHTCPIELLPWLAWALSVDEWDETWSDAQKRAVVAASYQTHSHKGTPYAIKSALQALGYDNVDIREGDSHFYNGANSHDGSFTYGSDGVWPLFDVVLNIGFSPDALTIQKIKERIARFKNARSVLRNLIFTELFYDGASMYNGAQTHNGGIL